MDSTAELVLLAQRLEDYTARYEVARDSRAVFTYTYGRLTRRLIACVGEPADLDWQWISRLAVAFGRRYFEAVDAQDSGATQTPAWAHVLGVLSTSRTSPLEELLFPLAAHIIRDLPHALCDVGLGSDRVMHLREFHHMNEVLGDEIERLQADVSKRYGPVTLWLDVFAGPYDEIMTNHGFRVSRATAWYNANRLLDARSHDDAIRSIERSPRILIETVTNPPVLSVQILFRLFRLASSLTRRWPARQRMQ